MFDIKSFYEARDVQDAVQALVKEPDAEVISGGTDVLIRIRDILQEWYLNLGQIVQ